MFKVKVDNTTQNKKTNINNNNNKSKAGHNNMKMTTKEEVGGSGIQGYLQLCTELEVGLKYI